MTTLDAWLLVVELIALGFLIWKLAIFACERIGEWLIEWLEERE